MCSSRILVGCLVAAAIVVSVLLLHPQSPARMNLRDAGLSARQHSSIPSNLTTTEFTRSARFRVRERPVRKMLAPLINVSSVADMLKVTDLWTASTAARQQRPMSVCIIGTLVTGKRWQGTLPAETFVAIFDASASVKSGNSSSTSSSYPNDDRVVLIAGELPSSIGTHFARSPQRRCDLSIIELDSVVEATVSSDRITSVVSMLRSYSVASPTIVFAVTPTLNVSQVARALQESIDRGYVSLTFACELRVTDGTSLRHHHHYHVRKMDTSIPLPSPNLAHILRNTTSWERNSALQQHLGVLTAALIAVVRTRTPAVSSDVATAFVQKTNTNNLLMTLAQLPEVSTICVFGFHFGLGAGLWLLANPTAKVVVFDDWAHDASPVAEQFLHMHGRGPTSKYNLTSVKQRLSIVMEPVSEIAEQQPASRGLLCDIVSMGGAAHTSAVKVWEDIHASKQLVNPKFHLQVVENTNCVDGEEGCVDAVWHELERLGDVANILRVSDGRHGTSVFQYTT